MFSGMFNSCTIHSVQINLNRPQDAKKVNYTNVKDSFNFAFRDDFDSCRFFSILVNGCHPNVEPIELKLVHVKRKLMLIN